MPTPVSALIHAATMVYKTKKNNNNNSDNKYEQNNNKVGNNGPNNLNSVKRALNPYFVTGYADGESSFSVRLRKSADSKLRRGYKILPVFSIGAQINPCNKELLEKIKEFFGGVG